MMGKEIPLKLWYRSPAPEVNDFITSRDMHNNPLDGWEKWSLPVGNGYMGANVFGRTVTERIQITEKSLNNSFAGGGLNNFAEILIDFGHENVSDYERELDLSCGVARTAYECGGIRYEREVFASYPDRVLVIRMTASKKGGLSFKLRPYVPFVKDDPNGFSKTGETAASGDTVTLSGRMEYYGILFEGQMCVITDGNKTCLKDGMEVSSAASAVIILAVGTNYVLDSRVFSEPDPKKKLESNPHPHEFISKTLAAAREKGYEKLLERHAADYRELFGRVSFDVGDGGYDMPTDELLKAYSEGENLPYLEKLYYQYGRYLLISSSRPGTLPANLQGTWNRYDVAPWGSGFWHNINVQMNYWPAMVANLAETFEAYAAFAESYMPAARSRADEYIAAVFPEKLEEPGKNGWIIGTEAFPYTIPGAFVVRPDGFIDIGHSGPGTGAFTSILFWEWYEFTRDRRALEKAFSVLKEMAHFLNKTLTEQDGHVLVKYSASPEQIIGGEWVYGKAYQDYYHTTGCAFDQQMVFENAKCLLKAAALLGREDDPDVRTSAEIIDRLDPVQIGASGQIKEYREEVGYGEIGEVHHRHISHLVGLYPGSCINRNTPEWMEAARVTLDLRGDKSTGWAMAHRLNAWARVLDGDRAYKLYRTLLSKGTFPNLWDSHPPFQIDGNFGGTSGVSEMLLQSHAGFVDILPAVPESWRDGEYKGLVARGNFLVDAKWTGGALTRAVITSRSGGVLRVKCDRMRDLSLYDETGKLLAATGKDGIAETDTAVGNVITVCPCGAKDE